MKRDAMIQHMLNTWAHLQMGGWSEATDVERMSELLAEMQAVGMQAPCCTGWGGHGKLTKDGSCDDYVESCNFKWEVEIEEQKPDHSCSRPDCIGYDPEKDK